MARRKKLKVKDSDKGESVEESVDDESVIDPPEDTGTVVVAAHTHRGVSYKSGDVIVFDNPASARKLRARGIIS